MCSQQEAAIRSMARLDRHGFYIFRLSARVKIDVGLVSQVAMLTALCLRV